MWIKICGFRVKNCTQTTQNHADALRNFAPLREKKNMSLCSYVKIIVSQKFVFFNLRESPRRLREANNTPQGFCVCRGFRVRPLPAPQALVKISDH